MTGTCKLCQEEKKLIKASHIISDFLHSKIYDEKHRLIKFKPEELQKDNPKVTNPLSATYDGGILCNVCDNEIIGQYETYVANVLKNNLKKNDKIICRETITDNHEKVTEISNLDYCKIKLFLLSLLWRAGISKNSDFQNVQLGPYETKIRDLIFSGDAGKETDFPITIIQFEKEAGFSTFIGTLRRHESGHTSFYSIIITGYLVLFHLKENKDSLHWYKSNLKETGNLALYQLPKKVVGPFVMGYSGAVKNPKY